MFLHNLFIIFFSVSLQVIFSLAHVNFSTAKFSYFSNSHWTHTRGKFSWRWWWKLFHHKLSKRCWVFFWSHEIRNRSSRVTSESLLKIESLLQVTILLARCRQYYFADTYCFTRTHTRVCVCVHKMYASVYLSADTQIVHDPYSLHCYIRTSAIHVLLVLPKRILGGTFTVHDVSALWNAIYPFHFFVHVCVLTYTINVLPIT